MHDRVVLMCSPQYFTVRDVKNPFMAGSVVDLDRAVRQWEALRSAFLDAGLRVEVMDAVEDLEDMVFAANPVFVGATRGKPLVVPSSMRHESRRREVPHYVAWFDRRGYEIVDAGLEGEYLEGHGDLLWHPGRDRVWAGYGFRSSQGGVERVSGAMRERGVEVTPLHLVDETFYHLDTCFAPLNEEAALVFAPALDDRAMTALSSAWARLYRVDRTDALGFACNGVVAGRRYVSSPVSPALAEILRREGLEPLEVDLSEFEKAGGSAFCLKTFVA